MRRLPITNLQLGLALHTCGFPLRDKVWRTDSGTQLSTWIDHDIPGASKLIGRWETGQLAKQDPRHPLLAGLAGIACLEALEKWLRATGTTPVFTVLPAPAAPIVPAPIAPGIQPMPLRTTEDLALAAAHITTGFLAPGPLQNAGDGTTPALPLLRTSATEPLLTREITPTLHGAQCTHPFTYALYAARSWIQWRLSKDPSAAKEFTVLLRGTGTRSAAVSRRLLDTTTPYIEVHLPNNQTTRVRNQFRDQMARHLRGLAAS